jgi:hypothetical protein
MGKNNLHDQGYCFVKKGKKISIVKTVTANHISAKIASDPKISSYNISATLIFEMWGEQHSLNASLLHVAHLPYFVISVSVHYPMFEQVLVVDHGLEVRSYGNAVLVSLNVRKNCTTMLKYVTTNFTLLNFSSVIQ